MVELETEIAESNADDLEAIGYVTTPGVRGVLKRTAEFPNVNGRPIWTGGAAGGEVNGYAAMATNNVPSNLDKGSSVGVCHALIFGAWSQLVIGEWGAIDILVNPYTRAAEAMIEIHSYHLVAVALLQPAGFAAMQDALVQ